MSFLLNIIERISILTALDKLYTSLLPLSEAQRVQVLSQPVGPAIRSVILPCNVLNILFVATIGPPI